MDAKAGLPKRSDARKRELASYAVLAAVGLLLIAGVIAFLQFRAGPAPVPAAQPNVEQVAPDVAAKAGGPLDPDAKVVATEFIGSTLSRTNLARAWDTATPELRSGVTRAEWLKGELPIAPFPVRDLETSGFKVVGSAPGKILLQVLLVPKNNSDYVPTRFDLTLVRSGANGPWRVSYLLPYAPPGIFIEPN